MCLADFAANYTTRSGHEVEDGESNDVLSPSEKDNKSHSRVKLSNNLGYMYKRGREAIIRFHRYSYEKETEKLYRSKLMLYLMRNWTF